MKQTAVEILVEGLIQECGLDDDGNMAKYIIQQAKEMFEQQIKDAYQTSHISMMTAEQYYNETFKQKP
jgi:Tat protein secretion system quality control protein TatD with DNase activity